MKGRLRAPLILLMTGAFVSAVQTSLAGPISGQGEGTGGTCFEERGMLDLSDLAVDSGSLLPAEGGYAFSAAADTLETYEIELEDEGGKGINYKAVIGLTIAAAFIGYALYILLVPEEDEEEETDLPTKPIPSALIRIPFGG